LNLFEFGIVKFKDKKHSGKTSKSKFRRWLTFKFDDEAVCALTTVRSGEDFLGNVYHYDDRGANSVVRIDAGEFNPPFTKISYIDCNLKSDKIRTFDDLVINIDWSLGLQRENYKIPSSVEEKICKAILNTKHKPNPDELDKAMHQKLKELEKSKVND